MTPETRKQAGILIVIIPTVIYGGVSILGFLIHDPAYMQNPLRQNLFRAGHAHAGVLLILSLVSYLYVDDATLSPFWKSTVKSCIPAAAIFLPSAFFFSVLNAGCYKTQWSYQSCLRWCCIISYRFVNTGNRADPEEKMNET